MEKWRIIISGAKAPEDNMGIDYALWQSAFRGVAPPTLRFYQWNPSSVSFGYNQSAHRVINTEFCKAGNIPIVKRPTGGSAIFHDIELTYSFSGNFNGHPSFASPLGSYFAVCGGIIKGMKKVGASLEIRGFSEGKEPSFTARDCFSLSSRHDIVCNNRKVVGSAQRRNGAAFLQHGSILLDIRRDLWENIFLEETDFSKIVPLDEMLAEKISPEYLIQILSEGFEEAFGVVFEEGELTGDEIAASHGKWLSQ
ncbi:MAG: lipoate--protein ligase family protein [Candidatus Omnitrophica bacterium]|nr:lipoate--protein ligase family protein [Candidatus Omnitrophota bacterium]